MIMFISVESGNKLVVRDNASILWVEPWGKNGLRVRMTKEGRMDTADWALDQEPETTNATVTIRDLKVVEPWHRDPAEREANTISTQEAEIINGEIRCEINFEGWLKFTDKNGKVLLEEYWRNRSRVDRYAVPLKLETRELMPVPGSSEYRLVMRFEAGQNEQIYGMGQYQEGNLNKKGSILELAHRNTQISIPFYISTRGYGFLWNNPAVGSVVFGTNRTEWTAERTKKLDYYITAGDTPKQIIEQYTAVTGRPPEMPSYGLGFWQSRLRYRTQQETLEVAREMKKRGVPLDVIVVDFFHWTRQGDFRFDPTDWPDPEAMIEELKSYGIKTMVSVWPTIDAESINRKHMEERGYLVKVDRGMPIHMNWMGETTFADFFNPDCRRFIWEKIKENYYKKGIEIFWLDEAEPEFGPYDLDIFRYYEGPALEVSNAYPLMFAKAFWDGMKEEGQEKILNLIRCAWVGIQKYGALVWSGDVHSSFRALREQLQAGLNMGIAGIPWWTADIGGFFGGDPQCPVFRELLIRWFEWGAFCPVFRLHGHRMPFQPLDVPFRNGVKQFSSGQPNEIWSYGEDNYEIMKRFIFLREKLRPYMEKCMDEAHKTGLPVMRAMFLEFPDEKQSWIAEDQYMLGGDLLVAPVMEQGATNRGVWLPENDIWVDVWSGEEYTGDQTIECDAPLDKIPVFARKNSDVLQYFK